MALQVCSRCRKRRIKCDLQLPACKNCRVADVECVFWDHSLGQEIPCSYLHSLRQTAQRLRLELQEVTDGSLGLSESPRFPPPLEQDYHHSKALDCHDRLASPGPRRTAYLGPGSSARLLERLLKSAVSWHLTHNVELPTRLLPRSRVPNTLPRPSGAPPVLQKTTTAVQAFALVQDQQPQQRKTTAELHVLIPRSTQRAIIDHYLEAVAQEYPMLSPEQESALTTHENPLRWSSSANEKDNPCAAGAMNVVLAVSGAMIARDLAVPHLSSIARRCGQDVYRHSQKPVLPTDSMATVRWTCTAACAVVLCDLVSPAPDHLWESLGRAIFIIEQLRECYRIQNVDLDTAFRRQEFTILKLESSVALHFRRPSWFCETRLRTILEDFPPHDALYGDLDFRTHLYKIADRLRTMARPAKELFDDLIPAPVPTGSTEVGAADCPVNVQLATLYVALHPLFTSSHLLEPSTGPDRLPIPDDVNDNSHTDLSSLSLFRIIATSASIVIDHYSWLNETGRILSLWMAAERVLEAGAIWAFHVVRQRALSVSSSAWERAAVERRAAMAPLLKVSTLLASFAARWKPGSAYSDAWEALVELIWTML